jgi:hypothetical protein
MPSFTLSEVAPSQVIKAAQVKAALIGQAAVNTVSFSATPTFDASLGGTQQITLTGDVSSSTLTNPSAGQTLTFKIKQDATGGRSFVWPTNVLGGPTIDSSMAANETATQQFHCFDGTNYEPISVGVIR